MKLKLLRLKDQIIGDTWADCRNILRYQVRTNVRNMVWYHTALNSEQLDQICQSVRRIDYENRA